MANNKKTKGSGKNGGSGGKKANAKEGAEDTAAAPPAPVQVQPSERVTAVRPFFETIHVDDRVKLLSVPVDEVRVRQPI